MPLSIPNYRRNAYYTDDQWMINDLKITVVSTWKYVDDTTVSEVVKKRRYQQSPRRGYHSRKLVEFQQITS
jgi:hypothetical protein